jgi:hypothetical protein
MRPGADDATEPLNPEQISQFRTNVCKIHRSTQQMSAAIQTMNIEILPEHPDNAAAGISAMQLHFNQLRKKLAREEKKQQKFVRELDALCHTYAEQVMPEMKNNHGMLKRLMLRLIDFSTRKSLSQWHREELEAWIHELLDQVAEYDRTEAKAIAELYMDIQYEFFGKRAQISDPDEFDPFGPDEPAAEPAAQQTTRSAADNEAQSDFFGFDDIPEPEPQEHSQFFNGFDAEPATPALDDKWLKRLFRRAAQALHPDRERDPARRLHKEQLMTELLHARDNNDMMTVMTLYQQHVTDDSLQIPESAFEAQLASIDHQIQRLQQEKMVYIYSDPHRARVHDLLYAGTRKKQQQNLRDVLEAIRLIGQQIPETIDELRNMNDLKRELSYRQEERFHFMAEQMIHFY